MYKLLNLLHSSNMCWIRNEDGKETKSWSQSLQKKWLVFNFALLPMKLAISHSPGLSEGNHVSILVIRRPSTYKIDARHFFGGSSWLSLPLKENHQSLDNCFCLMCFSQVFNFTHKSPTKKNMGTISLQMFECKKRHRIVDSLQTTNTYCQSTGNFGASRILLFWFLIRCACRPTKTKLNGEDDRYDRWPNWELGSLDDIKVIESTLTLLGYLCLLKVRGCFACMHMLMNRMLMVSPGYRTSSNDKQHKTLTISYHS